MRGAERFGVLAAAFLIAGSFAAFEAKASRFDNISVDVKATPGTYFSYGTTTRYTFYFKNELSSNYINNGTFRAYLSAGMFSDTFPVVSDPAGKYSCTASTDRTAVECSINAAPLEVVTFTLDAKMPSLTSTPINSVALNWNVRFGSGDAEKFIVSGVTPGAMPVTLSSNSDTEAQGAAVADAAFIYTGANNNIPNNNAENPDPKTAAAKFNPVDNGLFVVASIKEYKAEDSDPRCNANSIHCVQFNVDKKIGLNEDGTPKLAKAFFPGDLEEKLVFVLRIHPSQVVGKSISQSFLRYYPDGSTAYIDVLDCPRRAPLPDDGPCIASKFVWSKGAAQKVDPSLTGAWQYELWSNHNGFVEVF